VTADRLASTAPPAVDRHQLQPATGTQHGHCQARRDCGAPLCGAEQRTADRPVGVGLPATLKTCYGETPALKPGMRQELHLADGLD
jgi:hypothetical protein